MKTNTEHRRRETDKLGEWIQQAALDDANKRISELEANNQWQPIDTAPKGKWIIVCDENFTATWQACWSEKYNCFVWADGVMKLRRARFWMPLPPPPATAKEGE